MRLDRLKNATVNDVMANPTYYGMPNPNKVTEIKAFMDKMRPKADRKFASVEKGSSLLSAYVKKQVYFVQGPDGISYECKSLEQAERVAKDMGYDIKDLEIISEVIPDAGLKCDLKVTFKRKSKIIMPGQV